jgi:hypothetical protein
MLSKTKGGASMNTDPSVEYQYTKDDYATAFQLHFTPTRFGWSICALIILIMFIALFFFLRAESASLWFQILLPVGAALGGVLGGFIGWAVICPWNGRRTYAKQPLAHLAKSIALRTDGLHSQSARGESTFLWRDFISWRTNSKTTLLYLSPHLFIIIPARFAALGFPTDDLKATLTREMGPPRR